MFFMHIKHVQKHLVYMCSKRKKHYYQYNYHPMIELLVNKHIYEEQQAAQEYLNIAVTFLHPSTCLVGAGGYFIKMYNEELQHMLELLHYQLFRGGKPLICGLIPPAEYKNLTLLDAMKKALDLEKHITKLIEQFVNVAQELKDYQSADFVTSFFVTEQLKSIHEISQHITKLTMLNECKEAIYDYDLELAKKYPYCSKTKYYSV